jgi:3-oxoacyl-[acyl-carrier protein] reductase
MELGGKIAIVTGASRGIGRAIAVELGRRGARVLVNHRDSAAGADETLAAVEAAGGTGAVVQADVSRTDAAGALVKAALDAHGRLDILVNNAGLTRDRLLMMMSEDDFDRVIAANLKSVYNCCKAAARPMVRQRGGRIVNVTSVVGLAGQGGQTNYAAAKAGIIGFTKSLAKELGSRGITVNAVAPGFVETAMTSDLSAELKQQAIAMTPLGRFGTPEDVAQAVAFLCGDGAGFITGHVLTVDGGLVMQA